jgi:16S rRNA (adenine1518-N6/adenine1519-N6)-dimethyltransferase
LNHFKLYKPTELLLFLESLGIRPKRGLSQNFLIDGNIIRKIVKEAEVEPGDVVLEIGPGPGALTEALLAAGAKVIAVEKDAHLARALERLQKEDQRLQI